MTCNASAPVPAPNSQTSSVPVASSAWATWRARVWPNRGVSSGAVTKSLPPCGVWPNWAEALV